MREQFEGIDRKGRSGLRSSIGVVAIALTMLLGIVVVAPAGAMVNETDRTGLLPASPIFGSYGQSVAPVPSFRIFGFPPEVPLLVIVSMTGAGAGATFKTAPVGAASLAYGYTSWEGVTELAFIATQDEANRTLAQLRVTGGEGGSKAPIRVTVTKDTSVAYNSVNGHFYRFVRGSSDWASARDLAAAETFGGLNGIGGVKGYLATITNQAENDFIAAKVGGATNAWIGANDVDLMGQFKWMTGPEAGTVFWQAQCAASNTCGHNFDPTNPAVNTYSSWADGEPNNWGSTPPNPADPKEECVVINRKVRGSTVVAVGKWNDLPCNWVAGDGFVVEFAGGEGMYTGVLYESTAVSIAAASPITLAFNFFKGAVYKATRNVAAALKLKIGTKWRAILRSDPVEIGSGTIETEDDVVNLEMPLDLEPGDHSVTIEGTDPSGANISVAATFTLDESGIITAVDYETMAAPRYAG